MTRPAGRPNNLKSPEEYERLRNLALAARGQAPPAAAAPAAAAIKPDPAPNPAPAPPKTAEKLKIIKPAPPARASAYQRYQCGACFEYLTGPVDTCPHCGAAGLKWGAPNAG